MGADESKPPTPESALEPAKTANLVRVDFGQQIREQFARVQVDLAELKIAQDALANARSKSFQASVANDKFRGVYREDLDRFGTLLCNKLALKKTEHRGKVTNALLMVGLADESNAKMEEFSFDVDEFNFLYGFLFGRKRMDSNKVDIHYAISRLMFTVECKCGFTPKQLSAIKNHYGKNEALMSLKQEKVIMEITYV